MDARRIYKRIWEKLHKKLNRGGLMARAYVPIYFEWREPIALLSDAECGRLLRSLLEYGETGATKELGGNEKFLFALIETKNRSGRTKL